MTRTAATPPTAVADTWRRVFGALIGLATLAILLQGLWAGMFVREHQDYSHSWIEVHSIGAKVAIAFAGLATLAAFWKLRRRRDLWIGAAALTALLVLESFLGGLLGQHPGLSAVHFPLAMALLGLAVWLPVRTRRSG